MNLIRTNLLDRASTVAAGSTVTLDRPGGDYTMLVQYNGFNGSVKLQKSPDGSDWTDVATYTGAGKNLLSMQFVIPDIAAPDTILVPIGFNGRVVSMTAVIAGTINGDAAITLDTAGDDEICALTAVASGSAAGDVFSDTSPAAAYDDVAIGDYLKLATDGGGSTTIECVVTLVFETLAESGIEIISVADLDKYVRGNVTVATAGQVSIDLLI